MHVNPLLLRMARARSVNHCLISASSPLSKLTGEPTMPLRGNEMFLCSCVGLCCSRSCWVKDFTCCLLAGSRDFRRGAASIPAPCACPRDRQAGLAAVSRGRRCNLAWYRASTLCDDVCNTVEVTGGAYECFAGWLADRSPSKPMACRQVTSTRLSQLHCKMWTGPYNVHSAGDDNTVTFSFGALVDKIKKNLSPQAFGSGSGHGRAGSSAGLAAQPGAAQLPKGSLSSAGKGPSIQRSRSRRLAVPQGGSHMPSCRI